MLIELFGYLGSALVVLSMLMSSVVKLRVINMIGSVISGTYALIIGSFPLALMNICLILINIYNLRKLLVTKQEYTLVKCSSGDGGLNFFLEHYRTDIREYFPDFELPDGTVDVAYTIFCNATAAGVLLGRRGHDGAVQVLVEYTTPEYRDCSIGNHLYSQLPARGITRLQVAHCTEAHRTYLEKMGYTRLGSGYQKILN